MKIFVLILLVTASVMANTSLLKIAEKHSLNGEHAKAIAVINLLEKENKQNSQYYFARGKIFFAADKFDEAKDDFEECMDLDSKNAEFYFWSAKAKLQLIPDAFFVNKGILSSGALSELKDAVKINPQHKEARFYLAMYYINAPGIAGGSKEEAWNQAAILTKQDIKQGLILKAQLALAEKDHAKALKFNEEILKIDPQNVEVLYQTGFLYQQLKEYAKALSFFEKTLNIDPDYNNSLYQIGRTAIFTGENLDRGIECLERYLKIKVDKGQPTHADANWRLALLYEQKKDYVKAVDNIKIAKAKAPDKDYIQKTYQELTSKHTPK